MPSPPARRAAAPGPPAPARHPAGPRLGRSAVRDRPSGAAAGPGSALDCHRVRPRLRASCRAKSTCPASSCSAASRDQRGPGADDHIGARAGNGTHATFCRGDRQAQAAPGSAGPSRRPSALRPPGGPKTARRSADPGGLEGVRQPGGALALALASRYREVSTHGVAVRPTNSTAANGDPGAGRQYRLVLRGHLDLDHPLPRPASASITSTTHSGSPVTLSICWTTRSPLDRSKSRTFSTPRAANAPDGNAAPNPRDPTCEAIGICCCLATGRLRPHVQPHRQTGTLTRRDRSSYRSLGLP